MGDPDKRRVFKRRALLIVTAGATGSLAAGAYLFRRGPQEPVGNLMIAPPDDPRHVVGNLAPPPPPDCPTLVKQLRTVYAAARERYDEASWTALVSRFRGDTATELKNIGQRLEQIQMLGGGAADAAVPGGYPPNAKRAPRPAPVGASRALADLDAAVERLAGKLMESADPSCGGGRRKGCECAPGDPLCSCL
jgi:hypothetical protein